MRQTVKQAQLHFRFTEKDFLLDEPEGVISETLQPWKEKFEADKWKAVYEVGFEAKPDWVDVAGSFLYLLADMFQKQLTRQPDLELSREKTEVLLDGDTVERLLNSVPFTLGSECVTENWLKNAFQKLQNVFAEEISNYEGKGRIISSSTFDCGRSISNIKGCSENRRDRNCMPDTELVEEKCL